MKEELVDFLNTLEEDRLNILYDFLIELKSNVKKYKIKSIDFNVTPNDGDIDDLALSFTFKDENFNKVNKLLI